MGKKLYVGNLSYSVDSSELEQLFTAHGQVVSAQIINDRDTGRSKGFGFVEMANDAEADAAIQALNGHEHSGRALTVNEARPAKSVAAAVVVAGTVVVAAAAVAVVADSVVAAVVGVVAAVATAAAEAAVAANAAAGIATKPALDSCR